MLKAILGTKKQMSQTWTTEGRRTPVTIVQAGPVVVTQIKTQDKNGYEALQLGFGEKKIKNVTKPLHGHLKGVIKESKAPLFLREARVSGQELKIGDVVKASDVLSAGDLVKVSGTSKGKGFAGVVKRWGFHGGPRTHGQSDRERAPGSIGATTTPGRVLKGKKMAGRMGGARVTVKNLTVLEVNDDGRILLSGLVPGSIGSLLYIEKIGENPRFKKQVDIEESTEGGEKK